MRLLLFSLSGFQSLHTGSRFPSMGGYNPLGNLHVNSYVCTQLLFLLPSLGGQTEGRRVNIDAHSVPSQARSIWIHRGPWRTNNQEVAHNPPPCLPVLAGTSTTACVSPLSALPRVKRHLTCAWIQDEPPQIVYSLPLPATKALDDLTFNEGFNLKPTLRGVFSAWTSEACCMLRYAGVTCS